MCIYIYISTYKYFLNYFLLVLNLQLNGESIPVPLTSCLTGLDWSVDTKLNPSQSNRRSMVQWYFPFSIPWLDHGNSSALAATPPLLSRSLISIFFSSSTLKEFRLILPSSASLYKIFNKNLKIFNFAKFYSKFDQFLLKIWSIFTQNLINF